MRATLFATVFSLSIVTLPVFASEVPTTAELKSPVGNMVKKINLNQADVQSLVQSCQGIGQKRAEAIVQYRKTNGSFKAITDLAHVRGLGQSFVSRHLAQLQAVFSL